MLLKIASATSWACLDREEALHITKWAVFKPDRGPLAGLVGLVWTQKKFFTSRKDLLLEQTWTPGWAPGLVWTQKKLSTSRKHAEMSCFGNRPALLGELLGLFGSESGCLNPEMYCFFLTDLDTWLASMALFGDRRSSSYLEMNCF